MDKRLSLLSPHEMCLGTGSLGDAWSPAVGSSDQGGRRRKAGQAPGV